MTNAQEPRTPAIAAQIEALAPCPFCGGKTSTDRYGPEDADPEMAINCEGACEGIFVFPNVAAGDWQGLRDLWNTRATPTHLDEAQTNPQALVGALEKQARLLLWAQRNDTIDVSECTEVWAALSKALDALSLARKQIAEKS